MLFNSDNKEIKNKNLNNFKVIKPNKIQKNKNNTFLNNGRWTYEEHKKFLDACLKYGSNWKKVNKT